MSAIPPITDPPGSHWVQPKAEEILLTDADAVMPVHAFNLLREYSTSMPTGVYPGKMWRAFIGGDWFLRWYGEVPGNPDVCSNNQRRIQIMDWKTMMGIQ